MKTILLLLTPETFLLKDNLQELHDNIMYYSLLILFAVAWIMFLIIRNYIETKSPIADKYFNHGTLVELIWTITPAVILILIAFPSFKLLYLMDEVNDSSMAVIAEGHQWYWSYQYPDFLNTDEDLIEFDSYLVPESDLGRYLSGVSNDSGPSSSLPSTVLTDATVADNSLYKKLEYQYEYSKSNPSKHWTLYSPSWLNTPGDLSTKDANQIVKCYESSPLKGRYIVSGDSGEMRLYYDRPRRSEVCITKRLLKVCEKY